MRQGNFFILDENSSLEEGQVIFRYLPVTDGSYFPIYLAIKPYSIDFYYHSRDNDKNKDDSIDNDKKKDDKEQRKSHINVRILHLPLSLNLAVKDNLTEILKNNFDCAYPLGHQYKIDLDITIQYYWNLKEYYSQKDYQKIIKKHFPDKCQDIKKYIYFRKLVLDFLYDLEHSHVFENSPNYEQIEVRLKENFFFNAIAAKTSYYYYRRLYVQNKNDRDVKDLYSHKLEPSDVQWLKILRMKQTCELFWNSKGCFEKVEDEYEKTFFNKKDRFDHYNWQREFNKKNKDFEYDNKKQLRESVRWFLKRYNFCNALKVILFSKGNSTAFLLITAISSLILVPFLMLNMKDVPKEDYGQIVSFAVYLFAGFLLLIGIFALRYRKMLQSTIGLLMPRLIMALTSAWLIFVTTEELLKVSFDMIALEYRFVLILLLIPVIIFMAMEISNLAPDISPKKLFIRVIIILGIAFFYSIFIGLFFTNITAEKILARSGYLEKFYKNDISSPEVFQSDSAFAYAVGSLDANDEIFLTFKNNLKDTKIIEEFSNYKKDLISLPLRMAYFKSVRGIGGNGQMNANAVEKIMLNSTSENLFRSLKEIKYGNSKLRIMYIVPFFGKKIKVLPGILIFRSIFVIFMGIFIQLIFEDKPITEPL